MPHRRANPYIGLRRSCESPVIPAKAGIQRARQRSAHGAEGRKGCVRGSSARPRHSSEGWNPACATAERTRGGGAEGLCARFLSPAGPLALWERVRVRVATNDNCPLPHGCLHPYIGHIRRSREPRRHSSEGWNPACATAERTRAEGRKGCVRGSCLRRNLASLGSAAPTNDNCPLRHSPANPYIVSRRRSRADGNLTSPTHVDDRKCNEMQPNATELKVSSLLATPAEAKHSHNQGRLAQGLRVSGGPNEAMVASFPASQLGVNRAKQGQMGPGFTPPHRPPRRRHNPLALWERVRVRVRGIGMIGNERKLKVLLPVSKLRMSEAG